MAARSTKSIGRVRYWPIDRESADTWGLVDTLLDAADIRLAVEVRDQARAEIERQLSDGVTYTTRGNSYGSAKNARLVAGWGEDE